MIQPKYRRAPDIMFTIVEEDVLALNVEAGQCYGMENVTASVWKLLEKPLQIDQICSRLMENFEVDAKTCREDVDKLIRRLQAEGLIEEVQGT